MSHIEINGIRYSVEPGPNGMQCVTQRIDATTRLLSSVALPKDAVPVIAAALSGADAVAVFEVGELHAEIRAAVVADLQADHDAEIAALKAAHAEEIAGVRAEGDAIVVPITAAKPAATRRKSTPKK